jgi:hypothetical protein
MCSLYHLLTEVFVGYLVLFCTLPCFLTLHFTLPWLCSVLSSLSVSRHHNHYFALSFIKKNHTNDTSFIMKNLILSFWNMMGGARILYLVQRLDCELDDLGSNCGRSRRFSWTPKRRHQLWGMLNLAFSGYEGLFRQVWSEWCVELAIHSCPLLNLTMGSSYAFMACTGNTLSFNFTLNMRDKERAVFKLAAFCWL